MNIPPPPGAPPRAHYIDLIRGVCAISIVFIHTCFHSGSAYVPMPMRSLSLLLDVPAFFFISGMTAAYVKKDMILNSLFKLSVVFLLLGIILNLIAGHVTWASILRPLFLTGTIVPPLFKSVPSSYWFVPVFACTVILGSVLVRKFGTHIGSIIFIILLSYVAAYLEFFSFKGYAVLGSSLQMVLFPVGCYLFGYYCQEHIANAPYRRKYAVFVFVVACIVFRLCYLYEGSSTINLQISKFPVKLPYVAASCLSIAVMLFFYSNDIKNKFLEHVGRNAIFYYAGQGVSASCLYVVSPYFHMFWGIKLPIMFAINLALAIVFSEVLRLIYACLTAVIRADKKTLLSKCAQMVRSSSPPSNH